MKDVSDFARKLENIRPLGVEGPDAADAVQALEELAEDLTAELDQDAPARDSQSPPDLEPAAPPERLDDLRSE